MQALFTLTPSESKRLIAKAVAAMPEVQSAKDNGYLLVGRGSTNAYILEELLGKEMEKERYVAGQVIRGVLCALAQGLRLRPVTLYKGEVLEVEPASLIDKLGPGDVLLKGASAIDNAGRVGIVMASPVGGTVGEFLAPARAQGFNIIFPVGLEKMVPSVEEAAKLGGRLIYGDSIGCKVGYICITGGRVVTELEAIGILWELKAVHIASGGFDGAEGSVTIAVEGEDERVKRCMEEIRKIKGEPPLKSVKGSCKDCTLLCSFRGVAEEELPQYLRR